ncbi:MAG: hypothetical protein H7A20_00950 [Rhodanobacteraceae bacterium]|nr:hypothetical protein [Xanthomonadales bacterium]MCP5477358.1 hypothetical protein [Rhodanobacteraceae bacterium]HPF73948.1 hypothetical protein [Xanthomonadaceae bacterium]HRY00324.1 hypothetical protein [Xanthomonadaceae bacterium]
MTRRWRHRFAVAALLALLLQQVAIAGHLCAPGLAALSGATETVHAVVSMPCHGAVDPVDQHAPSTQADSGCRQHCDANRTSLDTGHTGSVPMLPTAATWLPARLASAPTRVDSGIRSHDGDPPPRQRFCSLLI